MTRLQHLASLGSIAFALAACGVSTLPPGDAGADVAPTGDVPPVLSPCPSAEPTAGASCTDPALTCEYGDDPRRHCRDRATCNGTMWTVAPGHTIDPLGATAACSPAPPATCPATLDAASGQTCTAAGAVCAYDGRVCECSNCHSYPVGGCGGATTWQCDDVPPATGCPAASPRFGEVCTQEGLACEYGCNAPDGSVACMNGTWHPGSYSDCPISTRRVKRDIAYVTPTEADALAAQVRTTRLATYEYTLPALAGRRRLGFILEDQPAASYSIDPAHSQVDLYGYTSLLVAAVQSQDRTIAALTRRLDALEHGSGRARRDDRGR